MISRILVRNEILRIKGLEDLISKDEKKHRFCSITYMDTVQLLPKPEQDLMGKLSLLYHSLCCGYLCKIWIQLCGVCALAQEGREIRVLFPRETIDYITFEPYLEYINEWRRIKNERDGNLLHHIQLVSKLSRILLKLMWCVTLFIFVVSFFGKTLNRIDMLVFFSTILQLSFFLLLHWNSHKFDLSVDALVKYFASGFVLSSSTAIIFELIFSLILKSSLYLLHSLNLNTTNTEQENEYKVQRTEKQEISYEMKNPYGALFYMFFISFGKSAFLDEVCKYYGYKMVEHPEFHSDVQLKDSSAKDLYTFRAHDISDESDAEYENEEEDLARGVNTCTEGYTDSIYRDTTHKKNKVSEEEPAPVATMPKTLTPLFEPTTYVSKGWAITSAMVSTALGFACCDNLIYLFFYRGTDVNWNFEAEWSILELRRLFPVHPICAAMQSVGVVRNILERDRNYQIGKTILPAILFHGSYDYSIVLISLFMNSHHDKDEKYNYDSMFLGLISFIVLTYAMLLVSLGLYSFALGWNQNKRLKKMDNDVDF